MHNPDAVDELEAQIEIHGLDSIEFDFDSLELVIYDVRFEDNKIKVGLTRP